MSKPITNVIDNTLDPYDSGFITGGVTASGDAGFFNPGAHTRRIDNSNDHWSNSTRIVPSTINITEDSQIVMGDDFVISGKEFKLCMKMLRKMAMEEHPEEFI